MLRIAMHEHREINPHQALLYEHPVRAFWTAFLDARHEGLLLCVARVFILIIVTFSIFLPLLTPKLEARTGTDSDTLVQR
jgi:hypothetical protein